jgi:hypothetical protein
MLTSISSKMSPKMAGVKTIKSLPYMPKELNQRSIIFIMIKQNYSLVLLKLIFSFLHIIFLKEFLVNKISFSR